MISEYGKVVSAGVLLSAMRHGRLRYEAVDGSSLRYAVPLIVIYQHHTGALCYS